MALDENSILLLHFPAVESSELIALRKELTVLTDRVDVRERQPGLQANIEWALPAALAIWVATPFVYGFLGRLGGKAADATLHVLSSLYERIKGRSAWSRQSGKTYLGPVIDITLVNALAAQEADIVFIFPAGLSQREFHTALSRTPTVVRRERNRGRGYFLPPGAVLGSVERSVKFYYRRSKRRWQRVWPN